MLDLLTSKLGLASIALALVLGTISIQRLMIHNRDQTIAGMRAAEAAAAASAKAHQVNGAEISEHEASDLLNQKAKIVTKYRTLVQRVPQIVTSEADRLCVISPSFADEWNSAVQP